MGFKRGFNKPYFEGVYVSKNDIHIWEYKVFHKTTNELSYLLAKEFRTNSHFSFFINIFY